MRRLSLVALVCIAANGCSTRRDVATASDGSAPDAADAAIRCDPSEDNDHDGISNGLEGCAVEKDSDGDEVPDWEDFDSDNDDIPDEIEAGPKDAAGKCDSKQAAGTTWPCDTDGDGAPDYIDTDSDGDGVADRDEDSNGDGVLGCCLAECGKALTQEQTADCVFTKAGDTLQDGTEVAPGQQGCGAGQLCQAGTCTPPIGFVCSMGETDRLEPETHGVADSETGNFVCAEAQRELPEALCGRGHLLSLHHSGEGDWRLALAPDAEYREVTLEAPGPSEAAAILDIVRPDSEVAGFIIARSTEAENVEDEVASMVSALVDHGPWNVLRTGRKGKSFDRYDLVTGTELEIVLDTPASVFAVRDGLLPVALRRPGASGERPGPSGKPERALVLRLLVLKRFEFKTDAGTLVRDADGDPVDSGDKSQWRLIVVAAMASRAAVEDSSRSASWTLDDLTNGTNLARTGESLDAVCEANKVTSTHPTARLLRSPISASLAVAAGGKRLGRGKVGFEYLASKNAIRPRGFEVGTTRLIVSYLRWTRTCCVVECE